MQGLRDEIAKYKVILENLEETGKSIIEDSNEDPKVVRDISNELNKISSPLEVVARKIADRQAKLQSALMQCQEFQISFDEFLDKLNGFEDIVGSQEPISALYDKVKAQRQENELLKGDVDQQERVFEKLMKAGDAVLENLEDEPEREALAEKINAMKERWEDVKKKVNNRQKNLETVETYAEKYRGDTDAVQAALTEAEKQLEAFEPLSVDKDSINKQKALVSQIKEAANKLKGEVPDVEDVVGSLKEEAEQDLPVLESEVDDIKERIEKLSAALNEKDNELTALEQAAEEYHVTVSSVEDVFTQAYDVVDYPALFGTDTDKAEERLAKIKVCINLRLDVFCLVFIINESSCKHFASLICKRSFPKLSQLTWP
mgnify:CR=1 FL=1